MVLLVKNFPLYSGFYGHLGHCVVFHPGHFLQPTGDGEDHQQEGTAGFSERPKKMSNIVSVEVIVVTLVTGMPPSPPLLRKIHHKASNTLQILFQQIATLLKHRNDGALYVHGMEVSLMWQTPCINEKLYFINYCMFPISSKSR